MKKWSSIESLSEDVGVSTRTGWRWLKSGRIQREREGDQIIFFLSENSHDSDNNEGCHSDVSSDTSGTEIDSGNVSRKKRHLRHFRVPEKELNHPRVREARADAETLQWNIEQEIAKLELAKLRPLQEPPELIQRRVKLESRKMDLEEYQIDRDLETRREEERKKKDHLSEEERQVKARRIIQEIKVEVLSPKIMSIVPSHLISLLYDRIESTLLKLPVLDMLRDELLLIGNRIFGEWVEEFREELREPLYNFFYKKAREEANRTLQLAYQDYLEKGGTLSYRNFIFSNIGRYPPEEQGW